MAIALNGDNERKKFRGHAESIIHALKETETLKEDIKSYLTAIKEEFGLPPKLVRRAIKTFMAESLEAAQEEQNDVETLIDVLKTEKLPAREDE